MSASITAPGLQASPDPLGHGHSGDAPGLLQVQYSRCVRPVTPVSSAPLPELGLGTSGVAIFALPVKGVVQIGVLVRETGLPGPGPPRLQRGRRNCTRCGGWRRGPRGRPYRPREAAASSAGATRRAGRRRLGRRHPPKTRAFGFAIASSPARAAAALFIGRAGSLPSISFPLPVSISKVARII